MASTEVNVITNIDIGNADKCYSSQSELSIFNYISLILLYDYNYVLKNHFANVRPDLIQLVSITLFIPFEIYGNISV